MTAYEIVDLFAGAGGWSEGLRMLGHAELGIDIDPSACATARAAGHERLEADVADLDPADYPCRGLIASAPCPTFSSGGTAAAGNQIRVTTVLAVHNSEGVVGRCDARCHDATTPECACICGGANHGRGTTAAIANTQQRAGYFTGPVALALFNMRTGTGATRVEAMPEQLGLNLGEGGA